MKINFITETCYHINFESSDFPLRYGTEPRLRSSFCLKNKLSKNPCSLDHFSPTTSCSIYSLSPLPMPLTQFPSSHIFLFSYPLITWDSHLLNIVHLLTMALCLSVTQPTLSSTPCFYLASSAALPNHQTVTFSLLLLPPSPPHFTMTCNTLTFHFQVYKDLNFCDPHGFP